MSKTAYGRASAFRNTRKPTPQSQPIPGREAEMKQNNAGGFTFTVTPWEQLERFLILGSSGGTYYVSEQKLTKENAKVVSDLLREDGIRVINRVVEISERGLAMKNSPALFVLALAITDGSNEVKRAVVEALPQVARTGTHLFEFAEYANEMRGWGRTLRNAIQNWYAEKDRDGIIHQITKYQQRNGWSHKDLLRLSHYPSNDAVLRYTLGLDLGERAVKRVQKGGQYTAFYDSVGQLPQKIEQILALRQAEPKEAAKLIRGNRLPREVVPTELLREEVVWDALLDGILASPKMTTALIRNLPTLTRLGILAPLGRRNMEVISALTDHARLRAARIHPMQVLAAFTTYSAGRSAKGSSTWTPVPAITDALDEAFYASFENVEPTGKRLLFGVDVSGSMSAPISGDYPNLSCAMVAACLAMVAVRTEKNSHVFGFTAGSHGYGYGYSSGEMDGFVELGISPRQRLDTIVQKTARMNFGRTDCALPFQYASRKNLEVDGFIVLTDNETWAGTVQPVQALNAYRRQTGIPARSVVVGMTATNFTIADQNDRGMLDVVGCSPETPVLINKFLAGNV